jgi:RNA polymerase sigma factor (TIGR02999 family)
MSLPPSRSGTWQVTQALEALGRGEPGASDKLLLLVYDDLHRMARSRLGRLGPGQTLQTTALVHDAWMRLAGSHALGWDSRAHFFGAASRAMRNILVEQARSRSAKKRGGGRALFVSLDAAEVSVDGPDDDLLALDEALQELEARDVRKAEVVLLRFFGGLEMGQVAEALGVTRRTAERDWRFARAWLQRTMSASPGSDGE